MNTPHTPFKTHTVEYSPDAARRRVYASSTFMVVGLFLSLLVVMFRPGGAEAVLPTTALVFDKYDADSGASVKYADVPKLTADYDIVLKGKKSPNKISLTGVPLVEMLKAGGANVENVGFATVRLGTADNRSVALIPLDQGSDRPAMVLDKGTRPGQGPFPTPALVPGQPTSAPLSERQIVSFDRRKTQLTIIPGKPGAKLMSVKITAKKKKDGQYRLSAKVTAGGSGGSYKYQWYAGDNLDPVSNSTSTYTTTDATSGTRENFANVVVTETTTGSTGASSYSYTARKADDGQTTNPAPKTNNNGSTNSTGGNTGGGGGTTTNGVFPNNSGSTTTPPATTPQITPPPTTTPPPVTTPPVQSDQDTSAITNVAQNIESTSGLQTVSGVLLSSPNIAPAGGGGTPIDQLPAPVATELNTIFQPVEDPGDLWPYLLAILFASTLAGAIRESISP